MAYNLILTNIPSPYRLGLWKEISKYIDIKILYTNKTEKRREWKIDFGEGYEYVLLKTYKILGIKLSIQLFREILKSKIIIIGGYGLPLMIQAILFCKLIKKPYILWSDGAIIRKENCLRTFIKRFLIRGASKYITTGIKGKEYLIKYGAESDKIEIIPLSIDVNYFHSKSKYFKKRKDDIKRELHLKEFVILFVGRIVEGKGIFDLIKVFNDLSSKREDISLLIVGNGDKENELKQIICNNKNIKFVGFVERNDLPLYYSISNIFVLPTHYDPWGAVINEAMACGLPVISTNMACASYELIKDGYNGVMINAGDIKEIQEKIELLLDRKTIKEYGKNSYNMIKSNAHELVAKKYVQVIKEVLNEN